MDSSTETIKHIHQVMQYLAMVIIELDVRMFHHDQSKLREPEKSYFDKYTPLLSKVTYGSAQYHQMLREMKPCIDHHQKTNRHHPEYFEQYVCDNCMRRYDTKL